MTPDFIQSLFGLNDKRLVLAIWLIANAEQKNTDSGKAIQSAIETLNKILGDAK
jgi:hypothetical protein